MYHFIYWYFYKYFRKRGNRSSSNATFMVGFALIIHIGIFYTVIHEITGWQIPYFLKGFEYGERKYILMALFIPVFLLLDYMYFRRKRLQILSDFKNQSVSDKKNIIKILLIMVVPLFLEILHLWNK